jgi:hypothetical protein
VILGFGPPRRWGPLAVGGLAALAVGTYLSFPTTAVETPPAPALRVVLFDASAGTTRRRPTRGLWSRRCLREQARLAQERGEELAVGLYGADARSLGLEAPEVWLERLEGRGGRTIELGLQGLAQLGSELDAGLALHEAELLRADRKGGMLILCAALDYSGPDPRPRLGRLVANGVGLEWIEPLPPELPDLALEGLLLPERPEPGAPLVARLELAAAAFSAERAELNLLLEQGGDLRTETLPLMVPRGVPDTDGYLRWTLDVDLGPTPAGRTHLAVRVAQSPEEALGRPDPILENNQLSASCRAGERRLVGLVARPERRAELAGWLEAVAGPGLDWLPCEVAELPSLLPDLDLVISVDLSPLELPTSLLTDHVSEGGSWLFCAGWEALAGWLPDAAAGGSTELAQLLPLVPATEQREPRDVVFLVDGSGSMEGEPFHAVQVALARLVLAVPDSDALSLQFFTGSLVGSVDLRVKDGGAQATLDRLFDAGVPGGATAILYSLEQYRDRRMGANRPALTFLLSDGKDEAAHDVGPRARELSADLSHGESRLVVISAGEDPDRELLGLLLQPGERLLEAGDLGELAELFQREVFLGRVREGVLGAQAASTGRLPLSLDLLEAWGVSEVMWPAHERFVRCEARPGADVLLVATESAEPLLAWQRVGSGMVAAWASSTLNGWAPRLRGSEDIFGPLLRLLSRREQEPAGVAISVRGDGLRVSGELQDWPAELRAELRGAVWGEGPIGGVIERQLATVSLVPATPWPGADPRRHREGQLPSDLARQAGGSPMAVRLVDVGTGKVLARAPLEIPCDSELQPAGGTLLRAPWRAQGRGAVPGQAADPGPHPRAWIWILAGVLGLFAAALTGAAVVKTPGT